jgi:hypothetical protein
MYRIFDYAIPDSKDRREGLEKPGTLEEVKEQAEKIAREHGVTGTLSWRVTNDGTRKGHTQVYDLMVTPEEGGQARHAQLAIRGPGLYVEPSDG